MECLRSFTQSITIQNTLTGLNSVVSFWTAGLNINCSAVATFAAGAGPAVFLPQGFKNINIYALRLNGEIISDPNSATLKAQIDHWGIILNTVGAYSQLSGVNSNQAITPSQNPATISLSRFANYIDFPSPIQSVTNISMNNLYIQASECQVNTNIALFGQLELTTYYRFEGE